MSINSSNFTQLVDDAIARRGYRISSRMPFDYRLRRYVELYAGERSDERLSTEEIDAVVGVLMLTDGSAANQDMFNTTGGQVTFRVNRDNTHTRTFTEGGHSMVRRSQVKADCCSSTRRGCSNTSESAMAVSCGGSSRPTRTHPMRLRSSR